MKETNLSKAFRELRQEGYFARQNFWCCSSCGWSAVPTEESDKVVFYHEQDKEDLTDSGECYLSWKGDGRKIIKILNSYDIWTQWDNSKKTRIKIKVI